MTRRKQTSKDRRAARRAQVRAVTPARPDHDCRLVKVRCDGCARVIAGFHAPGSDGVAPCPLCGSETAVYADPL